MGAAAAGQLPMHFPISGFSGNYVNILEGSLSYQMCFHNAQKKSPHRMGLVKKKTKKGHPTIDGTWCAIVHLNGQTYAGGHEFTHWDSKGTLQ